MILKNPQSRKCSDMRRSRALRLLVAIVTGDGRGAQLSYDTAVAVPDLPGIPVHLRVQGLEQACFPSGVWEASLDGVTAPWVANASDPAEGAGVVSPVAVPNGQRRFAETFVSGLLAASCRESHGQRYGARKGRISPVLQPHWSHCHTVNRFRLIHLTLTSEAYGVCWYTSKRAGINPRHLDVRIWLQLPRLQAGP